MNNVLISMFLMSFIGSTALLSYTIRIQNTTNSDMTVEISYGGPGVCSPDRWGLNANSQIEKGVGWCCAKSPVKFTAINGPYQGKVVNYDPPRTGFGLSCMSWSAIVKPLDDTFTVETK